MVEKEVSVRVLSPHLQAFTPQSREESVPKHLRLALELSDVGLELSCPNPNVGLHRDHEDQLPPHRLFLCLCFLFWRVYMRLSSNCLLSWFPHLSLKPDLLLSFCREHS